MKYRNEERPRPRYYGRQVETVFKSKKTNTLGEKEILTVVMPRTGYRVDKLTGEVRRLASKPQGSKKQRRLARQQRKAVA